MNPRRVLCLLVSSLGFLPSGALAGPAPELEKTVSAFVGRWRYEGTATPPNAGGKAVKVRLDADCKKTAKGKAVLCTISGDIPLDGPLEAGLLIGFDTTSKKVHYMAMTSSEEIHDHACTWTSDTALVCDPLTSGFGGQKAVEELSFTYDGKVQTIKSWTTMSDGRRAGLEVAGKRR